MCLQLFLTLAMIVAGVIAALLANSRPPAAIAAFPARSAVRANPLFEESIGANNALYVAMEDLGGANRK